ncbi:type II secretion system inner membrane protein GspF [Planctobacterium marinum]|uniref:Type II secretion system protein GspF n=1 Tax=Planctobacterium marinum TaxID=1631968 RepID=A0AA48HJ83_9ALTE|nr:type II secretion system protein GspF [Planctobacterium marinum]
MAAFSYKALDAKGRNKSGILEGDNARQIRSQLREKGLIPLEVEPATEKEQKISKGLQLFQPKISASDLALLTRQLATLVESALPLEEALLAVAEQCEKPRQKNMMMAVRSKVVEGHSLADAMAEFPYVFDQLFRAMVAAGEKSGHLDTVLNRLADYTEKKQHTRSIIVQAMVYPTIMVVVALVIVTMLLTYVVPKIVGQFDTMGQDLPGVTQFLINLSEWVKAYIFHTLAAIIIAIVLFKRMMLNEGFRLQVHRRLLSLPVMGKVIKGLNTSRFASTLSILTASAVPILEGMRISGQVLLNDYIKKLILESAEMVQEGSSLKVALGKTKVFPPMMMHMIASGEKSGELQQMLGRAANNQDREFEMQVSVALSILSPMLILVMAGIVFFIVIAILLPIVSLNSIV